MSGADFLSRWSRRKRGVEAAQPAEPEVPAPAIPADPEAGARADGAPEAGEAGTDLPAEEIARLPSIDDLTAGTDLAPFLRAGVPKLLRNAALRRMWSLDPGIRDYVSEAREYAYDWNTPGGVPGMGPLLPSDDVKAMLGQIFGDVPEPPASDIAASPARAADAGGAGDAVPDAVADPDADDADRQRDIVGEAALVREAAEVLPPPDLRLNAEPALAEPVETASKRPIPDPVRRHGGALPI